MLLLSCLVYVMYVWHLDQQMQQMVLILYGSLAVANQVVDGHIVAVARQ